MVQVMIRGVLVMVSCWLATGLGYSQGTSTLVMSASVRQGLGRLPGLGFAVQNVESGEIDYSLSLNYVGSRHSVIEELVPGEYRIIYLGVINSEPKVDSNVVLAFDTIKVDTGQHYYLGFINARVKSKDKVLEVQMCTGRVEKLRSKLISKGILREGEDLIELHPYKRERFRLPL